MKTLGFIGAGTIAGAVIEGLCAAGRMNPVLVSPRSTQRGKALAQRFEHVRRADSNGEVVANSDIVFLAIRPTQVEEALENITFRDDQVVCSFVTGISVSELTAIAQPATACRVLPLPPIAFRKGPIIHFPAIDDIVALFDGLGELLLPETEAQLIALGGVSGFMSSFFELQASLVAWLGARGVDGRLADLYTRAMLSGLSETGLRYKDIKLEDLVREHETLGGLNERTRKGLINAQWFAQIDAVFDAVQSVPRSGLK